MKKRTFKKIIGLMLVMVLLIVPCSNTALALDAQISTEDMGLRSTASTITNGIYVLQNPETSKYVDVDDGASTYSGAHLEQWDYDDAYTQKWFFTQVTDGTYAGYYTIMNMKSRLYMTVENSSSENSANVILTEFSGVSGQYWKIEATSNSRYKIIPACGETNSRVLCVNISFLGVNTNGLNILSKTHQDNDSYKDEWYLVYEPIKLDLKVIYDPQTVTSTSAYTNNLQYATAEILTNFGVDFDYSGLSLDSSLTQDFSDCVSQSLTALCDVTCVIAPGNNEANKIHDISECNIQHHRSAERILTISASTEYYTCRLVGFLLCCYNSNDGSHGGINGMANTNGLDNVVSTKSDNVKRTIQHELSHNLGASDGECTSGQYCVMNGKVGYWCTNCRNRIFYANAYFER